LKLRAGDGGHQALDLAGGQELHSAGGGDLGKARHGHHVAGERDEEARACRQTHLAHGDGEAVGAAVLGGIVRQRELRLCHADREAPIAKVRRALGKNAQLRVTRSEASRSFAERVLDGVRPFLEDHAMEGKTGAREFYEFEKALHARLMEAEREIVGRVMAASDVEADAIEIEGRVHRRVLRSAQTYMTAVGPVTVQRWLYKDRRDPTAHALAALHLKLGIVDGFWTTRARGYRPEAREEASAEAVTMRSTPSRQGSSISCGARTLTVTPKVALRAG
jgi:hypothetical protein